MIAERLRYLRKKKKLTMKEFGACFGLAESTISGYENGTRKPDLDTLEKFADYFEVTTDFLLGKTDAPLYSKNEDKFLNDINLPLEQLKEKYSLTYDGEIITDEEMMGLIAWIKANRSVKAENKK